MVNKNKDKADTKASISMEKPASCCEISAKRSCVWWTAVILALLLAVACYFYGCCGKRSVHDVDAHDKKCQQKISLLQEEISQLKAEMRRLAQRADQKLQRGNNIREKWKAWMLLKSKIESQEPLAEELEQFRMLFANDEETLKLVEEVIGGIDVGKSGDSSKVMEFCKKYLKKLIKFKKIDRRKLMKISGYVLSSSSHRGEKKE
ncbi:MAG: hypothetical protein LBT63_01375 [Holosporaceae bacterium]|nr:hypothetical protein [Holosporaceae bacterium]